MSRNKSWHQVAIRCVLVIFGRFKVHSCPLIVFCLSFQSIWINLDVKFEFPLETYDCNSSTSWPLQDGQSCFNERRTCQFSNYWLCTFFFFYDVSICQQGLPHWASAIFWWMAKNLMTNNSYDSRAANLLNSTVQPKSPWRCMSRIIRSSRTFLANIRWGPANVEDDFWSKVAQIMNKDTFIFQRNQIL